jgi:hypothetical protein
MNTAQWHQGVTYGNVELIEYLAEAFNLALHFITGLVPEPFTVGFLECDRGCLL